MQRVNEKRHEQSLGVKRLKFESKGLAPQFPFRQCPWREPRRSQDLWQKLWQFNFLLRILHCLLPPPPPLYLSQVFEFFKVGKMEIWDIGRIESPAAPPLFQYCFEILTHFPFRLCLQKTKTQKTKKDNDNCRFQKTFPDDFTCGSSLSM